MKAYFVKHEREGDKGALKSMMLTIQSEGMRIGVPMSYADITDLRLAAQEAEDEFNKEVED